MCGELNFPLYEIAKILDIHISHPILFIKSITCGQCQKMKYVKFEIVLFSFIPFLSATKQSLPLNQLSRQWALLVIFVILWQRYYVWPQLFSVFFWKQMRHLWKIDWNFLYKMCNSQKRVKTVDMIWTKK